MVRLISKVSWDRNLLEELLWVTMVLLLIGKGWYWRIKRVEVMWKVCAAVDNFHLKQSVELYYAIYRFRGGRGMGTATLESNMA